MMHIRNRKPRQPTGAMSNVSLLSRKDIATCGTDETICLEPRESRVERRSPHIGCKSYNFPTSHHTTRKTQTLTPMASNTGSTAPLIPSIPPRPNYFAPANQNERPPTKDFSLPPWRLERFAECPG